MVVCFLSGMIVYDSWKVNSKVGGSEGHLIMQCTLTLIHYYYQSIILSESSMYISYRDTEFITEIKYRIDRCQWGDRLHCHTATPLRMVWHDDQ